MASRTFSTSKSYGKPRPSRGRGLAILGGIMAVILVMALSLTTGWPVGPRTKRRMDEAMQDAYQWEEAHFHIGGALHRPHPLSRRPLRPDERDQFSKRGEGLVLLPGDDDARSDGEDHWMTSVLDAVDEAGLKGPSRCLDLHVGTVRPGGARGNHRHKTRDESLIVWGASGRIRVERPGMGYHDYVVDRDDVVVLAAPAGSAHAIKADDGEGNVMMLAACSDAPPTDGPDPNTDYRVWSDW